MSLTHSLQSLNSSFSICGVCGSCARIENNREMKCMGFRRVLYFLNVLVSASCDVK